VGKIHQGSVVREHLEHRVVPVLVNLFRHSSSKIVGVEEVTVHLLDQHIYPCARARTAADTQRPCQLAPSYPPPHPLDQAARPAAPRPGPVAVAAVLVLRARERAGARRVQHGLSPATLRSGMKSWASFPVSASANVRAVRCCRGTRTDGRLRQFTHVQ